MADRDVFVDTGGFYALLVKNDEWHARAGRLLNELRAGRGRLVTTDYVLDETATLLKARRVPQQAEKLFDLVERSERLVLEWTDPERFAAARAFFLRHADHEYSFTDCTSYTLMAELGLSRALTADRHFKEAGFTPLLTRR